MKSDQEGERLPNEPDETSPSENDATIVGTTANRSRKTRISYRSIPGVVEVVLKEPTSAAFLNRRPDALAATEALDDTPGHAIQRVLHKHNFLQASPLFAAAPPLNLDAEPVAGAAVDSSDQDRFFTLHFSADSDLESILGDLDSLPHVERVVPVPLLFPPSEPTQETSVGSSDELETSPGTLNNQWYIFR